MELRSNKVANLHNNKHVIFKVFHLQNKSKIYIIKIPLDFKKKITAFSSHIPNTKKKMSKLLQNRSDLRFFSYEKKYPIRTARTQFSVLPLPESDNSAEFRNWGLVLVRGGEEVWQRCQQSLVWITLSLRNPFQIKFH